MLVVHTQRVSWKCTAWPCGISTPRYLKKSGVGHAKSLGFTSTLDHLAADSWMLPYGHNCPGSPHNRYWLPVVAKSDPARMLCLDTSSTKVKANRVCGLPGAAPRGICRSATIPIVANTTRQLLRAHPMLHLQPGVRPSVSYT